MGLLHPALPFSLLPQSLLHLEASHCAFAVDCHSEIRLALYTAEVYIRLRTVYPRTFEVQFRMPTALRRTTPFILSQGSCSRLSNRLGFIRALRLPLSRRPFESHLSTTSRHLIPLFLPCLSLIVWRLS